MNNNTKEDKSIFINIEAEPLIDFDEADYRIINAMTDLLEQKASKPLSDADKKLLSDVHDKIIALENRSVEAGRGPADRDLESSGEVEQGHFPTYMRAQYVGSADGLVYEIIEIRRELVDGAEEVNLLLSTLDEEIKVWVHAPDLRDGFSFREDPSSDLFIDFERVRVGDQLLSRYDNMLVKVQSIASNLDAFLITFKDAGGQTYQMRGEDLAKNYYAKPSTVDVAMDGMGC